MKTRIFILYTGGTIGMGPKDPENPNSPLMPQNWAQLQQYMPSIQPTGYFSLAKNIEFEYLSFPELLDSSQFNTTHWVSMAEEVYSRYNDFDGFIIIHGTDTMAYTASALSFIFENLTKPIVITGAQLPISHTRTDAITNFSNAIHIAGAQAFGLPVIPEVTVCFNDRLFRGNRSTKISTRDFEGFVSPDYPGLAELEETIHVNEELLRNYSTGATEIKTGLNNNVAVLTLFPGFNVDLLNRLISDRDIAGLIVKTFGNGNAPCTPEFLQALQSAKSKGTFVMFITQCIEGTVQLGKYAASDPFEPLGVISGGDMTTEAALTKMMWVLGQPISREEQEKLLAKNLRGEVTFHKI